MASLSSWTPERDALLREMQGGGATAGQIAKELGVATSTVARRAKVLGLSFDQSRTAAATAVTVITNQSRRAGLAEQALTRAEALQQLIGDVVLGLDPMSVDARGLKDVATAFGILIDKSIAVEKHDSDHGVDDGISMLAGLAAALGVTGPQS